MCIVVDPVPDPIVDVRHSTKVSKVDMLFTFR